MLHLIRTAWAEPSLCRTITQATRPSKPGLLGGNPAASAITPPDECCIRRHSARFQRGQRLAQHVLGALVAAGALGLRRDHRGDRLPAQLARCREAVLAGDQREPLAVQGADRDRDDQAAHGHRAGERCDVLGVKVAHVAADLDPVDRDASARDAPWWGWTQWVLLCGLWPRRVRDRSPPPVHAVRRARRWGGGGPASRPAFTRGLA
ncbi:MAG TPA: hypothetical protein VFY45_05715, partial [Baekduia sp.]|nr:hypothetical protein [Baekduia sp.]